MSRTNPLIGAAELRTLLDSPAPPVLLDVRWSLPTGPDRAAFDAGHIPGACNCPSTGNLAEDGTFLPPDALHGRFVALVGAPGERGVVASYCGSGINAAQGVLALSIAGYDAVLYPGSWSEWVADPARPVDTGDR